MMTILTVVRIVMTTILPSTWFRKRRLNKRFTRSCRYLLSRARFRSWGKRKSRRNWDFLSEVMEIKINMNHQNPNLKQLRIWSIWSNSNALSLKRFPSSRVSTLNFLTMICNSLTREVIAPQKWIKSAMMTTTSRTAAKKKKN